MQPGQVIPWPTVLAEDKRKKNCYNKPNGNIYLEYLINKIHTW